VLTTLFALALLAASDAVEQVHVGPARVCFVNGSFDVSRGETFQTLVGGLHSVLIDVKGPFGSFRVSESDIRRLPTRGSRVVRPVPGGTVVRFGKGRRTIYMIYLASDPDGYSYSRLWIQGDAIRGRDTDRRIVDRASMNENAPADCTLRVLPFFASDSR
jgi:hypothetical protein